MARPTDPPIEDRPTGRSEPPVRPEKPAKSGPKRPYGGGTRTKGNATSGRKPTGSAARSAKQADDRADRRTSTAEATERTSSSADGAARSSGGPNGAPRGERVARDGTNRGPAERSEVRRKGWGSVANRGVERALIDEEGIAQNPVVEPDEWIPEEWIDEGLVRDEAEGAVARASTQPKPKKKARDLPPDLSPEDAAEGFEDLMPAAEAQRAGQRLAKATKSFEREQYIEAQKALQPLAKKVPMVAPVRELLGLTYYRLGKWRKAIAELEAFCQLTGSTEQHPVLADCHRALGKPREVERLWDELCAASPGAALVTEGRIVMAGMLADRGKTVDAIKLLEKDFTPPAKPQEHQLRRMYVLADLYDRSGEIQRASKLFRTIAKTSPDFADVQERLEAFT